MNLSPAEAGQRLKAIVGADRQYRPRGDHAEFHPLGPPCPPLRLPAEWEPVGAVIVSFPLCDPRGWKVHADFIQAISTAAKVFVLVGNEFWQKAVEVYLTSQGVDLENLSFFQIPAEDVWTRDYGPFVVFAGAELQPVMIWNPYFIADQAYYKFDADAAAGLAMALGLPLYRLPLVIEGGNLISDGRGTIILSESVLEANPEVDREGLEQVMRDYFGCTRLITLPALPAEITGHIDMAVKFIQEDTLLVASALPGSKWHGELERMASRLSQIQAGTGQPYRVIRVPLPRRTDSPYCFWSYVNSLTLNGKVMVPLFRVPEDEAALELYRSAMPGYEVKGVDFHRYPVGSAHCQAKEIPAPALTRRGSAT
jgi:agmatine deiminase